ncbi:hypothetical protein [Paenibacillus xylanexedens]|uniref:hypothetical protein n=1 Tax=Paenibacillus xylanexedens TaxID=528191 RepID=UPI001643904B|nr:hypothetical protein [Paenibacillus xylanexedens]
MKLQIDTLTNKHLQELGGFDVPNPQIAKAITMQRLNNAGYSDTEAVQAIRRALPLK